MHAGNRHCILFGLTVEAKVGQNATQQDFGVCTRHTSGEMTACDWFCAIYQLISNLQHCTQQHQVAPSYRTTRGHAYPNHGGFLHCFIATDASHTALWGHMPQDRTDGFGANKSAMPE